MAAMVGWTKVVPPWPHKIKESDGLFLVVEESRHSICQGAVGAGGMSYQRQCRMVIGGIGANKDGGEVM